MCTAYELGKRGGSFPTWVAAEGAAELLGLTGKTIIRPTLAAPVIMPAGNVVSMRWGFRISIPGGKYRSVVNSREDKLSERTWKKAFEERRCIIPAAAFYEWIHGVKGAVPLRFERPDDQWLWIAGLWRDEPERGQVFSMITTDPNETSIEMISLAGTKLVAEEAGSLIFTVATMRQWFAAQALRKGWVDPMDLMGNLPRLRRWVDPLAIFIATSDFDSATRYFEPLTSNHPAVAANVIENATRRWGPGEGRPPSEFENFALRARRCLEAWILGIAPLGNVLAFTDSQGQLLPLRARSTAPYTEILFFEDPTLPGASAMPLESKDENAASYHLYQEPDEPSHLWRQTFSMVSGGLLKFVERQRWELADNLLAHEEVWHQAVDLTYVSRWFATSVPWEQMEKNELIFRQLGYWDWICEMRSANPHNFPAPNPAADNKTPGISFIPALYSPEAALARARSTYSMAMAAYQRIVTRYFPKFRHDLDHSSWWPCRLTGTVFSVEQQLTTLSVTSWWVNYRCEPVESDNEAIVEFNLGEPPHLQMPDDLDTIQERAARIRPNARRWYWTQSTALNLHDSRPATALVREWLMEDFKSCGWNH